MLLDKFTFHRQPSPDVASRHGVPFEPLRHEVVESVARPEHDEFEQDDIIEAARP